MTHSRLMLMLALLACGSAAALAAEARTQRSTRPPAPQRPGPPPASTAPAELAARDYVRKVFPELAAKRLAVNSVWLRHPDHPKGEEVVATFYEMLPANGARSGNYVAVRVKRRRQVFLERKRQEPVPAAASVRPAVTASRAQAIAVAAVGSGKSHSASRAMLLWHGRPINRLAWGVDIRPRAGGHPTAYVVVDAQNGAVLAVNRYRETAAAPFFVSRLPHSTLNGSHPGPIVALASSRSDLAGIQDRNRAINAGRVVVVLPSIDAEDRAGGAQEVGHADRALGHLGPIPVRLADLAALDALADQQDAQRHLPRGTLCEKSRDGLVDSQ